MTEALPTEVAVSDFQKLAELREKNWDLLDQSAMIEVAIAALLNKIRGSR